MSLLTGLVGHWKFDDGSGGTAADSSGNGYDGTIGGTTAPIWATKHSFACLDFSPSGDGRVAIPADVYAAIMASGQLTYSLWVDPDAFTVNYARLISTRTNTGFSTWAHINVRSTGKLELNVSVAGNPNAGYDNTGTITLNTGAWTHVAMTVSGSAIVGYCNAVVDKSVGGAAIGSVAASIPMWIGNDYNFSPLGFDGGIREVRVYDRALSATEILTLYQGDRALFFNVEW